MSGQDCLSLCRALSHHDIAIVIIRRLIRRVGLRAGDMRRYVELHSPEVVHNFEDAHCAGLIHCRMQRLVSDAFGCSGGTRFQCDALKWLHLQPSAMVEVNWGGPEEMGSGKVERNLSS